MALEDARTAWKRGYMFAYYLERGYSIQESHRMQDIVPEHLIDRLDVWFSGREHEYDSI